ncbi:MAG: hypothetical protein MRQ11_04660 [Candidatus Midichloria mitochondrii]|uniref:hypothetical protein n=1 Tax=Candidatus Midichloria mitochondrii TaxID=234827 RepID=UPI0011D292CA|nr:hypothetical protein [Candidatus Midichloria mitochondrii]MDJ1583962.1 hypothetical protein [Candidatus Midichloria mitochondrii]
MVGVVLSLKLKHFPKTVSGRTNGLAVTAVSYKFDEAALKGKKKKDFVNYAFYLRTGYDLTSSVSLDLRLFAQHNNKLSIAKPAKMAAGKIPLAYADKKSLSC